jgi:hypothetical protein
MLFKGSNNLVQIYRSFAITGNDAITRMEAPSMVFGFDSTGFYRLILPLIGIKFSFKLTKQMIYPILR